MECSLSDKENFMNANIRKERLRNQWLTHLPQEFKKRIIHQTEIKEDNNIKNKYWIPWSPLPYDTANILSMAYITLNKYAFTLKKRKNKLII